MRAAIYLRVSTDDKGQTVENQRQPLRVFCTAQGWTEAVEYADEASATDLRGRREWRRLLDDAGWIVPHGGRAHCAARTANPSERL